MTNCGGYDWILTLASFFVGHYLKEFYSKFGNILTDNLSLITLLENKVFDNDCFYSQQTSKIYTPTYQLKTL